MTTREIENKAEQFFAKNYPLIQFPVDCDEIDYFQMIEFIEWLVKKRYLPCKHKWVRTTRNYKHVHKCYLCGEFKDSN